MSSRIRVLMASMALLATVGASAQPARRDARTDQAGQAVDQRGGSSLKVRLLKRRDVQKELKITADQRLELDSLNLKEDDKHQDISVRISLQKLRGRETSTLAILTKTQRSRLRQIEIQMQSGRALLEDDLQKTLGLKASQKRALLGLQRKWTDSDRAIYRRVQNGDLDQKGAGSVMENNNKILRTEVEKVLTASQRAQYTMMQGKKFTPIPDFGLQFSSNQDFDLGTTKSKKSSSGGGDAAAKQDVAVLAQLLKREDVRKDLNLTSAQKKRFGEIRDGTSNTLVMKELALTPKQETRLKEVRLWIEGGGALSRPEVQKELGLSAAQKRTLSVYEQKMRAADRNVMQRFDQGSLSRRDSARLLETNFKTMGVDAGKILTSSQQKKLSQMKGKKFAPDTKEPISTRQYSTSSSPVAPIPIPYPILDSEADKGVKKVKIPIRQLTGQTPDEKRKAEAFNVQLLKRSDVQNEIKLTTVQKKGIREVPDGTSNTLVMGEARLTSAQQKRLGQIRLWIEGGTALARPEIQKGLGLTKEQIAKIKGILKKSSNSSRNPIAKGSLSGGDLNKRSSTRSTNRASLDAELLRVLTPAQRKKFDVMRGKQFKPAKAARPNETVKAKRGGGGF